MIIIKILLPVFILLAVNYPVLSQKYKTASDTVKLNKEYLNVSNDIAELTSKLTIAQNNLPGYHTRAGEAASDAQSSAMASSEQAAKATNGDIDDARSAKRKARKALNKAKDSEDADDKIIGQDKKISKLTNQLHKKQRRLEQLEDMRSAIRILSQ